MARTFRLNIPPTDNDKPIGQKGMILNFPNESRSFDDTRKRVRFWGYDGAIEISFLVEGDALRKLSPDANGSEAGFLKAFDAARKCIYQVAEKVYVRSRKSPYIYILAAADF